MTAPIFSKFRQGREMTFASAGMSEQRVGILKPQICETRRYIMAKLQRNQEIFEIVDSRYFDPLDFRCSMMRNA